MSLDDAADRRGAASRTPRSSDLTVLIITMVALAVVAVAGFVTASGGQERFESRAVLLIDQPQAIAASDGGAVLAKLSQLRLKYTGLLDTRELTEPIADEVGGEPDAVAARVDATAVPESLLIVVTAAGDRRDDAVALADAASEALRTYVEEEHDREDIPAADRFVLREVTPAAGANVVDTSVRTTALQVIAGLATLGLVAAPVVYVVRRRREG